MPKAAAICCLTFCLLAVPSLAPASNLVAASNPAAAGNPAKESGSGSPSRPQGLPLARPGGTSASPRSTGDLPSLLPVVGSLGIVLGLFFVVTWLMRRGMPAGGAALPADVVEVLGRTTLAARQQLYLVRCAHKLLLVSLSANGATTLTEITDSAEVDRLTEACRAPQPRGATAAFRQALGQLTREASHA